MQSRSQWIFTEDELKKINKIRLEIYKNIEFVMQSAGEYSITKKTLFKFIQFMRNRKKHNDLPWKFQKTIYYAIALYKRYYLLNIYQQDTQMKHLICAVYLSLKLNQYDEGFISKTGAQWKKKSIFQLTKRFPHYGQEGYTAAEMQFLSGIRFQTALSKLIQPIESIYQQANEIYRSKHPERHFKQKNIDFYHLIPEIQDQLDKIYYHPDLIFLFEGPKLALAAVVAALRRRKLDIANLGEDLRIMIEQHMELIERIIYEMNNEFQYTHEQEYSIRVPKFKKPEPRKASQSPRFKPRHDTYPSID